MNYLTLFVRKTGMWAKRIIWNYKFQNANVFCSHK